MATLFYFSYPYQGHVNASLDLVATMIGRGHKVYYFSNEPFRDSILATGAIFVLYRNTESVDEPRKKVFRPGTREIGTKFEELCHLVNSCLKTFDLVESVPIEEYLLPKPQMVLYDNYALWGRTYAQRTDLPAIACVTNYPLSRVFLSEDIDYFFKNVFGFGDLGISYSEQGSFVQSQIAEASQRIGEAHKLARFDLFDFFSGMETLNVLFVSRDFLFYSHALDSRYFFVGPQIATRSRLESESLNVGDGTVIYISLGGICNNNVDFYNRMIDCFRDTQYIVYLSVAACIDTSEKYPNITTGDNLHQISILRSTDVFVTHGGTNSVGEAILMEVPMVVIPQFGDQYWGAEMVRRSGIGIVLGDRYSNSDLVEAIAEITLNRSRYMESLSRLRKAHENDRRLEELAALMETMIRD